MGACSILAAAAMQGDPASGYTWKNVVVKGGGFVSGLVYHPTQRNLFYARTDVGGAYRWDEATQTWLPLNDALGRDESQLTGVLSVALDPADSNRVYLACGQYTPSWASQAAVLASTDKGVTWTRANLPLKLGGNEDGRGNGERLQVDPTDGRILLLGTTNSGLWRSADRGVTWSQTANFPASAVTWVLFDAAGGATGTATKTIYVGVNNTSAAVLRSTDGGTTWASIPGQPTGLIPLQAKLSSDRQLYLTYSDALGPNGATRGAVWRLDAATDTWTNITPPTGQGGFSGVAVDAQRPAVILVSTLDRWSPGDELYYSTNRGATWSAVMARSTRDVSAAPYAGSISPHWITDVEIDPFNSARAWFVTGYGVFATDSLTAMDSGGTVRWDFRDDGLEETVGAGIVSPPIGPSLVSAIYDIDGFRHESLDQSPSAGRLKPSYGSNTFIDFAEQAPSVLVRLFSSGTRGAISRDGGTTWIPFPTAPATATTNGAGTIAISADGTRLVWTPSKSIPYFSSDDGATWTASTGVTSPGNNSFTAIANRSVPKRFYLYDSAGGRLYSSTDYGATFALTNSSVPTGGEMRSMAYPYLHGMLWLAANEKGLWLSSDDDGSGFAAIDTTLLNAAYRIGFGKTGAPQEYPAIYVWGRVNGVLGVFRSEFFGAKWTRLDDDQHRFGWINAITGDPRVFGRVYLATGGRGIVYGDLPASLLPPSDFAAFTVGTIGTYTPTLTRAATGVSFSVANLPPWATLNSATGTITGSPAATVATGSLVQVTLRATETNGTVSESTLNLFVAAPGSDLNVVNMSALAPVGTGDDILIPGISIAGSGTRDFLIRAVGPTLADFSVGNPLLDPRLTLLHMPDATTVASNDDWQSQPNASAISAAIDATKAFPLRVGSKDAAVLATLSPGGFTAKIEGVGNTTGMAMLEVYDVTAGGGSATLSNIAVRAVAGSGSNILAVGLVMRGGGSRRFLIRGIGPGLRDYGLANALADPQISLYLIGVDTPLATAGPWGASANSDELRSVAQSVGAFPLVEGGNDTAMIPRLVAGSYSIVLGSRSGGSGPAMIELYVLP